jgi:hypothetical protein
LLATSLIGDHARKAKTYKYQFAHVWTDILGQHMQA